MQRVHVTISGDVQGVGFRSWVRRQAQELGLTGWVRNRDDGTVEVVAEGTRSALDELVKRCRRGPETAWVADVAVQWSDATDEFVTFEVYR